MQNEQQKIFALRLKPGEDLKISLVSFAKEQQIKAGYIITCVGSLQIAVLRLAGKSEYNTYTEKFEILSLTGTLSSAGVHLHIAIADENGKTIGGHLVDGNIIYTTAEIIIGEALNLQFERMHDEQTGYLELHIKNRE